MSDRVIEKAILSKAALTLFDEAYFGPRSASETWFVDNEEKCGFIGVLEGIDAAIASKPLTPGDPATVASHAGHLRFSLSLANRAAKGEDPYKSADWSQSWAIHSVDEMAWKKLVIDLRKEYEDFRTAITSDKVWDDENFLTGTLGLIAHGAWHLGAIRQGLGLIRSPRA